MDFTCQWCGIGIPGKLRFCSRACANKALLRVEYRWWPMAVFLHTFCKAGSKMIAKVLNGVYLGEDINHNKVLTALKRNGVHDPVRASMEWSWMANRSTKVRVLKHRPAPLTQDEKRKRARDCAKNYYYRVLRGDRQRSIDAMKSKNPGHRIKCALRLRIWKTCKRVGALKSDRTEALIGCSIPHFRAHIESKFKVGMTWDNYGQWHIDHVRPCASFDLTSPDQQRECFHFSNLQPLWAQDNRSKHARYGGVSHRVAA